MISENHQKNLWELLWEYDPNALIVVDAAMKIKLVNPAFCQMFSVDREAIIGQDAADVLEDTKDFEYVWQHQEIIRNKEQEYPQYNLYVRQVIFPIPEEDLIACIIVDLSHEQERRQQLAQLKNETVKQVNEVVDNQMKIVQEIAGLLGETTAETKVSLLKIIQMLEKA